MNSLLHQIDSIDRRVVETTDQLRVALDEMLAKGENLDLINTYVVTVYGEMLSDGSAGHSVGIRIAERV